MGRFRAIPYARALHSVLSGEGPAAVERGIQELAAIAEAIRAVPDLVRVMVTPTVPPETKTEILEEVLEKLGVGATVRRFAHVLQRHFRLEQVPEILVAYRDEVDRSLGRVRARVELAAPLPEKESRRLVSVLEDVVDATVIAEFVEKPELLAGFRAQVGSKVFDGSLVAQIDQLRRQAGGEQG